jgi:hypothetical protein
MKKGQSTRADEGGGPVGVAPSGADGAGADKFRWRFEYGGGGERREWATPVRLTAAMESSCQDGRRLTPT